MIAVDTNILVYAHRADMEFHVSAAAAIRRAAEGPDPWAIPWPCVHEFLAVATNPRIFKQPTPIETAIAQVDIWMESPSLRMLGESAVYWPILGQMVSSGKITGARVHDARIAAVCRSHGVRELWSADRDFSRMPEVRVVNPLMAK